MKRSLLWAAVLMAGTGVVVCGQTGGRAVPAPDNPGAYQPVPIQKPLPAEALGQPEPGQPLPPLLRPGGLPSEAKYVEAYVNRRRPRIMVFVNRTIHGDVLGREQMAEVMRTEETHSATGAVSVNSDHTATTQSSSAGASAGITGTSSGTSNTNSQDTSKSSFTSGGPADYTKTTSVKVAADKYDVIGASRADYEMIEASLVDYLDAAGKVQVQDSDAAREKLGREVALRIENSDRDAIRLLNKELQADVLIRVDAVPTQHSQWGPAVRILAKAVGVTDGRNYGYAFVDMPLPMTKPNINIFTGYLADKLEQKMTERWAAGAEWDPIEVRIYKAATVDDSLKIRKFMQGIKGVTNVTSGGATGGSTTSYALLRVMYGGAPEDLYGDLKDALGRSTGLKAVDLQSNTISLEVTGEMNLVTTTQTTETKVTTETHTVETKTVEPIRPATAPAPLPPG